MWLIDETPITRILLISGPLGMGLLRTDPLRDTIKLGEIQVTDLVVRGFVHWPCN